jgi:hypothetical protein
MEPRTRNSLTALVFGTLLVTVETAWARTHGIGCVRVLLSVASMTGRIAACAAVNSVFFAAFGPVASFRRRLPPPSPRSKDDGETRRKAAMTTAAVAALLWTSSTYAATLKDAHIRSDSAAINAAIDQAIERSATFRQLTRTIEDSDSIVFLTEGDCGHNEHACFTNVTTAGPRRIMWVTIDLRKAAADWDVMGSIAHELRHTVEVINEPRVRNFGGKFGLYCRIGFREKGGGFETLAALDAGNAVREEVRSFERHVRSK